MSMPCGVWGYDSRWKAFVPCDGVPVSDRGFRFGMHVFETIAFRDGQLLLAPIHFDLLDMACESTGFPLPPRTWLADLALVTAGLPDGVIRIFRTAGDGAPTAPVAEPRLLALFEAVEIPTALVPESGTAVICEVPADDSPWVKSGNYWRHIRAQQRAVASSATDAVLTTSDGWVLSAAMGNIFVSIEGDLITPPAGPGVRPGAVREWLLQNHTVIQRVLHRDELAHADECFLTNSRVGLRPLTRVGDTVFPDSAGVRALWAGYQREVVDGSS
ncbi:MAG: aminotransferase class IV [Chthoniobacterales bacterium]